MTEPGNAVTETSKTMATPLGDVPYEPEAWSIDDQAKVMIELLEWRKRIPFTEMFERGLRATGDWRELYRADWRDIRATDAGISQEQLGEILGVSRITVNRWESGKRSPNRGQAIVWRDWLAAWDSWWCEYAEAWVTAYRRWVTDGRPGPLWRHAFNTVEHIRVRMWTTRLEWLPVPGIPPTPEERHRWAEEAVGTLTLPDEKTEILPVTPNR